MINFPNVSPEIFSINLLGFDFTLRWYAVSYIIGFIFALRLMKFFIVREQLWRSNEPPLKTEHADAFLTYLIFGVIIGGRLGYVLFYNFDYYYANPFDVLRIWDGGMAFHGGFLGVVAATAVYCFSNSIPIWSGADLIAVATPPGLFFGRVANFINVELWGKPTNVPWGVIFPGDRAQACEEVVGPCARHPSQLYEAGLEGILLFVILFFASKSGALRRPGLITGLFALGYGVSRFFVEYYRVPDPQFFSSTNPFGFAFRFGDIGLTMGQMLSLPMILIGVLLVVLSVRYSNKIAR